jgi:hypothetical protein
MLWFNIVVAIAVADPQMPVPPEVAAVVDQIAANEVLFEHLETEVTVRMDVPTIRPTESPRNKIRVMERRYRAIWQGSLFYGEEFTEITRYDGSRDSLRSELGFDGELARGNGQGQYGSIYDSGVTCGDMIPAHRLGMGNDGEFRLSEQLTLAPSLRAQPAFDSVDRCELSLLEPADCHGVRCIRIRALFSVPENRAVPREFVYWVAPERNYLVAKTEDYMRHWHPVTQTVVEVEEWLQVSPGVWCPKRAREVVYRSYEKNRPLLDLVQVYEVKSVNLKPNYGLEQFRNIVMPENVPIYEIRSGQLADKYMLVNGRKVRFADSPASPLKISWHWLVWGSVVVSAAILTVWYAWRRRSVRC